MPKISAPSVIEHRERTRDALLDAMEVLVLERPFLSISMRDVAERAGVTRTAIYNYVPDTVTLLTEATVRGSTALRAAVAARAAATSRTAPQRLHDIVDVLLLEHLRSTSTLLAVLAIERHIDHHLLAEALESFRSAIGADILRVVREGVTEGVFAPLSDPSRTLRLMVGVVRTATQIVAEASAPDRAGISDGTAQFLVNALSPPRPAVDASGLR